MRMLIFFRIQIDGLMTFRKERSIGIMDDADKMNNGYLIDCGDRHIELKLNKKLSFLDFYVLKKEMTHLDYDKLLKEEKEYEMRTV